MFLFLYLLYRRLNKKARDETIQKKKSRKIIRVQRSIVGASLEDIKKRQAPKPKTAASEAAAKEVKANKAAAAAKKAALAGPAKAANNIPKVQARTAHR